MRSNQRKINCSCRAPNTLRVEETICHFGIFHSTDFKFTTNRLSFESAASETCPNCSRAWWFWPDDLDWNANRKYLTCPTSRPRKSVVDRFDSFAWIKRIWCHRLDTVDRKSMCTVQRWLGNVPDAAATVVQVQAALHTTGQSTLNRVNIYWNSTLFAVGAQQNASPTNTVTMCSTATHICIEFVMFNARIRFLD